MKFLFASDSFKGSLTSEQTIELLTKAAGEVFPDCECIGVPVADGGEGTVNAVVSAAKGRLVTAEVHNPLMKKINAAYGITDGNKAIIEMSAASGLPLVPEHLRNPMNTTTYGTGELILDALDRGCRDISARRDHVAQVARVRLDVRGELRGEAGLFHGRDRDRTCRHDVAGTGAGQGSHESARNDGHIAGAAGHAAEQGKNDRDRAVDHLRFRQQDRHGTESGHGIQERGLQAGIDISADLSPGPRDRQQQNEADQHGLVDRTFQQQKPDDDHRQHDGQVG